MSEVTKLGHLKTRLAPGAGLLVLAATLAVLGAPWKWRIGVGI